MLRGRARSLARGFHSAAAALAGVKLTPMERLGLTASSAVTALLDPMRGDMIAVLGETTGGAALRTMRAQMADDAEGRRLLQERPRIRRETVEGWDLASLPDDSLGRAYADFMGQHGYDADSRAEVRYVEDEELAYVLQRYREVHDFLHVLTGLPPSVLGELALKWYELVQTGLPMTALAALVGPLRLDRTEAAVLRRYLLPWAAAAGRQAQPLLLIPVEQLLSQPLTTVRRRFRIQPAPDVSALLERERDLAKRASGVLGLLSPFRAAGFKSERAEPPIPSQWGSWRHD